MANETSGRPQINLPELHLMIELRRELVDIAIRAYAAEGSDGRRLLSFDEARAVVLPVFAQIGSEIQQLLKDVMGEE